MLESPMPDVRFLFRANPVMWLLTFLSSYRFPTSRFLAGYDGPLLVIHGDGDTIIPYAAGQRVFSDAAAVRKVFVAIPGADHNDLHLVNPDAYWGAIDAFVAGVGPGARGTE